MATHTEIVDSPIGPLALTADEAGLIEVEFCSVTRRDKASARWRTARTDPPSNEGKAATIVAAARSQLADYFAGRRRRFELPLNPRGTAFQQAVWSSLAAIPFGATVSYGELARRLGKPTAARAVGAANGQNPLAIILPCHRVVGADGSLTGYAGGLEIKRKLLEHEAGHR
jgi:methylated-DNA-[protein]-cysteine S-methyltransferase